MIWGLMYILQRVCISDDLVPDMCSWHVSMAKIWPRNSWWFSSLNVKKQASIELWDLQWNTAFKVKSFESFRRSKCSHELKYCLFVLGLHLGMPAIQIVERNIYFRKLKKQNSHEKVTPCFHVLPDVKKDILLRLKVRKNLTAEIKIRLLPWNIGNEKKKEAKKYNWMWHVHSSSEKSIF